MKCAVERFNASLVVTPSCWLWVAGCFESGYGRFFLDGKLRRAHRVSYELHHGPIGRLHVLHRCDRRACVNPDHLFLGTHDDNMADMARKGRVVNNPLRGAAAPGAKLTDEQALAIKGDPRRQADIAAQYGIHQVLVSRIKTGKAWAHL